MPQGRREWMDGHGWMTLEQIGYLINYLIQLSLETPLGILIRKLLIFRS